MIDRKLLVRLRPSDPEQSGRSLAERRVDPEPEGAER